MARTDISAKDHVKNHWGESAPSWVLDLAKACDETSQKTMAQKIGKSAALVNQVLKNKYPGRLDLVQISVETIMKNEPVPCPVLGILSVEQCFQHQNAKFDCTNSHRVRLFKACQKCPFNAKNQGDQK